MSLEIIKKEDKQSLKTMAEDFANYYLCGSKDNRKVIGLHGIENQEILDFFKEELQNCLSQSEKDAEIIFARGSYNIDVGYFLRAYNILGMNPHYLIDN